MASKVRKGSSAINIDGELIATIDASKPAGISRTGWVHVLIQEGMVAVKKRHVEEQASV